METKLEWREHSWEVIYFFNTFGLRPECNHYFLFSSIFLFDRNCSTLLHLDEKNDDDDDRKNLKYY